MSVSLDDIVIESNYTHALKIALFHKRVSMVGYNALTYHRRKGKKTIARIPDSISKLTVCQCCGRFPREPIHINFKIREIGFLGAGHPLFFTFQKLCMTLLVILFLIVTLSQPLFNFIINGVGESFFPQSFCETDIACLLVLVFVNLAISIFAEYMVDLEIVVDQLDTSPEDYSLWVSNIPLTVPHLSVPYNPQIQLKNFFENSYKQKLQVVDVCLCYNLVPLSLLKTTKRQLIEEYKGYYQDRNRKQILSSILFDSSELPFERQEYYGVLPTSEAKEKLCLKDIEQRYIEEIGTFNKSLDEGYVGNNLLFLGEAIVSFQTQDMREFLQKTRSTVQGYMYGHKLKVRKAEHPKGIFWHNLHLHEDDYRLRKNFSLITCAAILLASFVIQILLSYGKTTLVGKYPTAAKITSFIHPIVINLINLSIPSIILHLLPSFEGHRSRSDEMLSFVKKSVLLQLLNTLLLPFIIRQFITHDSRDAFIIKEQGILFRNCLFILIGLTIPKKSLTKQLMLKAYERGYVIKKLVKELVTVKEFCEMYEYPVFEIDFRSSEIIKTMLLTFVFGYESYRVIIFAMVCMVCCYWIDKYNLARRRTVKFNINSALNTFMMRIVHLTVTIFILMMIGMHGFTFIKAFLLILSVIRYAKPAIFKARARSHRQKEEQGSNLKYSDCKRKIFETDYRRENPAVHGQQKRSFYSTFADETTNMTSKVPGASSGESLIPLNNSAAASCS